MSRTDGLAFAPKVEWVPGTRCGACRACQDVVRDAQARLHYAATGIQILGTDAPCRRQVEYDFAVAREARHERERALA